MELFTGTADYYHRYRPGIPPEAVRLLDAAAPRHHPRQLLDLGTGTGLVISALIDRFDAVIGVDPDTAMLTTAEQALRPHLPPNTTLDLVRSTAEDYTPPLGWAADLVTFGRSFHWMSDQPRLLARLDAHVNDAGAIAILGDGSFWSADTAWAQTVRNLIQDFLGTERRAGTGTYQTDRRPYGDILRDSAFSHVDEHKIAVTRTWTTHEILGYLYSTSFAARPLFTDRVEEFEAALATRLRDLDPTETFIENAVFTVLLATRASP